MLKLCLAHPVFYPTFGGGSLRFLRYQPGLAKRDIQTRVLTGTPRAKDATHPDAPIDWLHRDVGEMLPIESVEGVPVHRVRLPDATSVERTSTYFRALIALCRKPATRPDLIQLHSFERLEALLWLPRLQRLGIPLVYAIQITSPIAHRTRLMTRAHRLMLRRFYGHFDGIVTSSERIASQLRELGSETPIAVIPNGVDLERYRPRGEDARKAARERLGLRGRGPVVLSVGAVSPRKGSDLLIDAWSRLLARHPELELVLVGPRPDPGTRKASPFDARIAEILAAAGHREQIHLPGVRDDVDALYAAADLVVLPTSREGGTPNVVLEAMASGVPVLLTPFEGQSIAIGRPGIEFVQCARTGEALTQAIGDLLANPLHRAALGETGRRWVEQHLDLDRTLDRFTDFYERAASRTLEAAELESENPSFPSLPCMPTSAASASP